MPEKDASFDMGLILWSVPSFLLPSIILGCEPNSNEEDDEKDLDTTGKADDDDTGELSLK